MPVKKEAGKKASASLDAGSLWWRVFISTMQESKQMTETLGHGGTNSAQPRTNTQMGIHGVQQLQEILLQSTLPGSQMCQLFQKLSTASPPHSQLHA